MCLPLVYFEPYGFAIHIYVVRLLGLQKRLEFLCLAVFGKFQAGALPVHGDTHFHGGEPRLLPRLARRTKERYVEGVHNLTLFQGENRGFLTLFQIW